MNRFRKFCGLKWGEKVLFCEALSLHLFAGLLLKVVPFRLIPRIFRSKSMSQSGPAIPHPQPGGSVQFGAPAQDEDQSPYNMPGQQSGIVEDIRVAVQRAGWVSPWKNRCLVSSLAARCMLRCRKIGSELSLGVAKNSDGKLIAHAWLKSGDFEIVEERGSYTELFLF